MALNFKHIENGVNFVPQNSTTPNSLGDVRYNSSTNRLEVYNGALDKIVTESSQNTTLNTQQLVLHGSTSGSITVETPAIVSTYNAVLPAADGSNGQVLSTDGAGNWNWITVSGAVVSQPANTVFAGPTSGGSAVPTFRALVSADIPSLSYANQTLSNLTGFSSNGIGYFSSSSQLTEDADLTWDATHKGIRTGIIGHSPTLTNGVTYNYIGSTVGASGFFAETINNTAPFGGAAFVGYHARGTNGSPTAVQANDILSFFGAGGYNGSAYSFPNPVGIELHSNQNFTPSAQGTAIHFGTTADGTTTRLKRVSVTNDGALALWDAATGTTITKIFANNSSAGYSLTLPVDTGTNGQFLTTNGAGALSWTGIAAPVNALYISQSSTTVASTAKGIVKFPTSQYDTNSAYNTSTGIYTIPTTGKYRISSQITWTASTGNSGFSFIWLSLNGTSQHDSGADFPCFDTGGINVGTAYFSKTLSLTSGDQISFYLANETAQTVTIGTDNQGAFFSIEKID